MKVMSPTNISKGLQSFPSTAIRASFHGIPRWSYDAWDPRPNSEQFWIKDSRIGNYGPIIVSALKERGLERASIGVIGLEVGEAGSPEGIVPYNTWRKVLESLPDAHFSDATWWFREVMIAKSAEELSVLRYCATLGERACQAMLDTVKPGATEFSVFQAIQDAIHSGGGVSHDPFLIMTWGKDDIGWSEPPWAYYGGAPRKVEPGDLIMAELFPAYGGLETQQQMSVAIAPVEPAIAELGTVARHCYDAGIASLRPGNKFSDVWQAMLKPLEAVNGWSLTPMIHSVAPLGWVGGMGFNLEQMPEHLKHFRKDMPLEMGGRDIVLKDGMSFAFEPNACRGQRRVNVGGSVVVRGDTPEQLNTLANRLHVVN